MKPSKPVTAETLRADRDRRQRERDRLAEEYERAADVLDEAGGFRGPAALLRYEAERWRRPIGNQR